MTTEPLAPGCSLPPFTLHLVDGGTLTGDELRGRPCVLFFYPKDDTPGCTTEAKDFSALLPRFHGAGIRVVGVSKDGPARHRRFIARHGLAVPLASDAAVDGLSDTLGIWGEKRMYGRVYQGMARTTLLLDAAARIARVWHKVKVPGHAAEVLEAALRMTASDGRNGYGAG